LFNNISKIETIYPKYQLYKRRGITGQVESPLFAALLKQA